ncbi:DUF3054 domain-containing protein [Chloroflexi bacterium CFX6]|nr:DUF3054 domain-containing protein [Chloroflexi bacterium CFX6]
MIVSMWTLILGDLLAMAVVTLIGFATHGAAELSFLPRIAAVYFPLSIAWFLLASPLGLFKRETVSNPRELWRPAFAMLFAAPFAAVLRGLILDASIIPVFVVVLGATSALGMFLWRGLCLLIRKPH